MPLEIDAALCPQNHRCPLLKVCPAGAITQQGHELPAIDPGRCIECGQCVRSCGMGAVYQKPDDGKTV